MSQPLLAITEALYRRVLFPFALTQDPEVIHDRILHSLGSGIGSAPLRAWLRLVCAPPKGVQQVKVAGLLFPNCIGLAAGFDKDARALPLFEALGFGHIEVGTVTPLPQSGNPRPRIVRFPSDHALINRMGFPSTGATHVEHALARWRESHPLGTGPLIGVNIGKQKETPVDDAANDYVASMRRLSPYADYVTVNVSSPNTPELRKLQEPGRLRALFQRLQEARTREVPLLVKLSPDLAAQDLDDIVRVVEEVKVSGIIATNTTLSRDGLARPTEEVGGLSGPPLHARSVAMVRALRERLRPEVLIVGVGGIRSAQHVREFIDAGASLVQLYTGLVYEGPTLVRRILREL